MICSAALLGTVVLDGCGNDEGAFKPAPVILDPSSPDNVLNNLAVSYDGRDMEEFGKLLDGGFTFRFTHHDVVQFEELVPDEGQWSRSEEIETTDFMFSLHGAPDETYLSIKEIDMDVIPSVSAVPCNMVGAPPGTVEKTAQLRLTVKQKRPDRDLVVITRPLFYFAPDSSSTPVTWKIWMIEDDIEVAEPNAVFRAADGRTPVPIEEVSWGFVKGLYWSQMNAE
jgi:hypothetical protein